MPTTSRALRTQIQRVARAHEGHGRRYPTALRRAVIEHAQERLEHGATVKAVARTLDLADQTLGYWLRSADPGEASAVMRAVAVRPEPAAAVAPATTSARAVVVTPQGFRIEGLELAEIVSLVRSFG